MRLLSCASITTILSFLSLALTSVYALPLTKTKSGDADMTAASVPTTSWENRMFNLSRREIHNADYSTDRTGASGSSPALSTSGSDSNPQNQANTTRQDISDAGSTRQKTDNASPQDATVTKGPKGNVERTQDHGKRRHSVQGSGEQWNSGNLIRPAEDGGLARRIEKREGPLLHAGRTLTTRGISDVVTTPQPQDMNHGTHMPSGRGYSPSSTDSMHPNYGSRYPFMRYYKSHKFWLKEDHADDNETDYENSERAYRIPATRRLRSNEGELWRRQTAGGMDKENSDVIGTSRTVRRWTKKEAEKMMARYILSRGTPLN
ncbi:hypothetical protein AMATHDRAFT_54247 [Amanita thiersii Skay4041]|uniref:Uncharacterized protein n=1 Tax=Amanita thiersii Skay4041 TaxID=703135 RepID=A0A2A9NZZ9_9AGAR|nr:hypothetical protein AMATHDRAFT_54247 [Amanita thiersii Skay4041]